MQKTTNPLIASVVLAVTALALSVMETRADIITFSPDTVNRIDFLGSDTVDTGNFGTRDLAPIGGPGSTGSDQFTILTTSTATLLAELQGVLGPLGAGESYQINSATLTVGSSGDDYTNPATAHLMLTSYDDGDITWNESDDSANTGWASGAISASDFNATAIETGVAGANTVVWDELGPTVQGWVDGGSNPGLFFNTTTSTGPGNQTSAANVEWTLDAQVIPEPSALALFAAAFGILAAIRRRKES